MRKFAVIAITTITCAFKTNAQVINYAIDQEFSTSLMLNRGNLSDILLHENGDILVTGDFNNIGSPAGTTALFDFSGNLIITNGNAGTLYKLSHYKNLYINFGHTGIMRFGLPNQIDPVFSFEFSKPAYNFPIPNRVHDAIVMPDDHILVAGRFFTDSTLVGTSIASQGLRQLCMIDSTGAPVEGFPMLRCEWPTNAEINSIVQLSTGDFIIAGSFNEVDGLLYPKLAKLNSDYSVNNEFEPVFAPSSGDAYITYLDSQDRVWVILAPSLEVLGQANFPGRIIRILPDGSVDSTLQTNIYTTYVGDDITNPTASRSTGATILEDSDGTFILGGSFIEVNGEPHNRLIKINDAGEIINGAFGGIGPDEAVWSSWTPNIGPIAGTSIRVLRKLPNGELLIGGQFSSFGGEPYSCLVRLEPSGFVGVDDLEGRGKLKLWPNPAHTSIQVALPDANERIVQVEIYDLQGRTIAHSSDLEDGQARIEIQDLASGIYLVKAGSAKGVYTQKLIKN